MQREKCSNTKLFLVRNSVFGHFSRSEKNFQLTFTCSKSAIETLEKGVKYVLSCSGVFIDNF